MGRSNIYRKTEETPNRIRTSNQNNPRLIMALKLNLNLLQVLFLHL